MAISLVGNAGTISTSATTSVSPAFGQSTTAGHLLTARVVSFASGSLGGPATTATGWVQATSNTAGSATVCAAIFYKANCGSGETAPVFTSTNATYMAADLTEWNGAASAPLDQVDSGAGAGNTNAAADSTNADLALICAVYQNSKSATWTFTDSWTPSGGTVAAAQGTATIKNSNAFYGSAYLLNGFGGGAADKDIITVTPSTGSLINAAAHTICSFFPAAPPDARPILTTLQGVMRASTW